MKNLFNIISLILIFLILFSHNFAQQNSQKSSIETISNENNILTQYDTAKNETLIYIYPKLFFLGSDKYFVKEDHLSVNAGFTYSGKNKKAKPEKVEVGITSLSFSRWKFDSEKSRKLAVEVDGQEIDLGTMQRIEKYSEPLWNQQNLQYLEKLAVFISYENFEKIAISNKVFIKLDNLKYKLSKENLKVFLKLLSEMK